MRLHPRSAEYMPRQKANSYQFSISSYHYHYRSTGFSCLFLQQR